MKSITSQIFDLKNELKMPLAAKFNNMSAFENKFVVLTTNLNTGVGKIELNDENTKEKRDKIIEDRQNFFELMLH